MKNIFYFRELCAIGGTEQFLYEIAKKYDCYDITIYYDIADTFQLERLKKYVRCKKRKRGEIIKCDRAFYNFNIDMIEQVEAKEHIFVAHAIYQELGYKPPIDHPKLNRWIGVSKYACGKIEEYARKLGRNDIKAELCYNPQTLEPKEKILRIVSAGRLDDKVKGGERVLKLIKALDRYCEKTGKHYIWTIFSNPVEINLDSLNVVLMKARVDVRPYIADADWFVHLPNDMETFCYSDNEALGYGVPIVTTPLSILKELPITDNEHLVCEWDMSNADEIAKQMFEKKITPFEYEPPKDNWTKFLVKGKSTYLMEREKRYFVEAIVNYDDLSLKRAVKAGEQFEVNNARKDILIGENRSNTKLIKIIKEIKEREDYGKREENG